MTRSVFALTAVAALAGPAAGQDASPRAAGAKAEKLAGGFQFTEGPAPDADGNVYFTDQPNDRIIKWSTDGKQSTFMQPCGRSNGLCFDRDGKLLACADENNQLWSIDVATKKVDVLVKDYQGKLLNGPNDVWVAPDNSAYFTDPLYPRDYWKRDPAPQQDGRHVSLDWWRASPNGRYVSFSERLPSPFALLDEVSRLVVCRVSDGKTISVRTFGSKSGDDAFQWILGYPKFCARCTPQATRQ